MINYPRYGILCLLLGAILVCPLDGHGKSLSGKIVNHWDNEMAIVLDAPDLPALDSRIEVFFTLPGDTEAIPVCQGLVSAVSPHLVSGRVLPGGAPPQIGNTVQIHPGKRALNVPPVRPNPFRDPVDWFKRASSAAKFGAVAFVALVIWGGLRRKSRNRS